MSDSEHDSEELPEWWLANIDYKEWLGLPEYLPPKFEDGVYLHEVISPLESQFDCSIVFVNKGEYGSADMSSAENYYELWEVRVDGESRLDVSRYRTEKGNVVYNISSSEFKSKLLNSLVASQIRLE